MHEQGLFCIPILGVQLFLVHVATPRSSNCYICPAIVTVRPINSDRKFLFFPFFHSCFVSPRQIDNEREENQTKKTPLSLRPVDSTVRELHFLTRINAKQILGQLSSDNRITLLTIVSRSISTTRLIVSSCKLSSPICRFVACNVTRRTQNFSRTGRNVTGRRKFFIRSSKNLFRDLK